MDIIQQSDTIIQKEEGELINTSSIQEINISPIQEINTFPIQEINTSPIQEINEKKDNEKKDNNKEYFDREICSCYWNQPCQDGNVWHLPRNAILPSSIQISELIGMKEERQKNGKEKSLKNRKRNFRVRKDYCFYCRQGNCKNKYHLSGDVPHCRWCLIGTCSGNGIPGDFSVDKEFSHFHNGVKIPNMDTLCKIYQAQKSMEEKQNEDRKKEEEKNRKKYENSIRGKEVIDRILGEQIKTPQKNNSSQIYQPRFSSKYNQNRLSNNNQKKSYVNNNQTRYYNNNNNNIQRRPNNNNNNNIQGKQYHKKIYTEIKTDQQDNKLVIEKVEK